MAVYDSQGKLIGSSFGENAPSVLPGSPASKTTSSSSSTSKTSSSNSTPGIATGSSSYGGGVVAPGYTVSNGQVVPAGTQANRAIYSGPNQNSSYAGATIKPVTISGSTTPTTSSSSDSTPLQIVQQGNLVARAAQGENVTGNINKVSANPILDSFNGFVVVGDKIAPAKNLGISSDTELVKKNVAAYNSGSQAYVTPSDLVLYGGVAKIGVMGLAAVASKVIQTDITSNLFQGGLNQAGRINFSGGLGSIYSKGTVGEVTSFIGSKLTADTGKEVARFGGAQGISQGLYFTSQQTVPAVRGLYASGNTEYKQQQDVLNVIPEGYGLGVVKTGGGSVPIVNSAGQPVLDDKGKPTYETYTNSVNPVESFLVSTVQPFEAISLGKGGLFGTGFFSEETRQKRIDAIKEKVRGTASYQAAGNKEKFLDEVVNTEFFGGQVGAALAIPQYEFASEIGISSLGKYVAPAIMKKVPGRTGLALSMAAITPFYGGSEGLVTSNIQAQSMRTTLTPEQKLFSIGSGALMATTINVATGATFFKAKSPYPKVPGKLNSQIVYYGAKSAGYGFDLPELAADKTLDALGIKSKLGINMGVATSNFIGAPTPSPGTVAININPPNTGAISRSSISDNLKIKGSPGVINVGSPSNVNIDIGTGTNTNANTGTNSNTNTSSNTNTNANTNSNFYSFVNTNTTTNTATNSNTSTSTNTNVSTVVSPFVPFMPFFGLPGGEGFSNAGSGKKKTKYYNELSSALGSFKSLDFGLYKMKKKKRKGKK